MTIEQAKAELPMILGKLNGVTIACKVSGRERPFALVAPWKDPGRKVEVCWQTVANCATNARPIYLD